MKGFQGPWEAREGGWGEKEGRGKREGEWLASRKPQGCGLAPDSRVHLGHPDQTAGAQRLQGRRWGSGWGLALPTVRFPASMGAQSGEMERQVSCRGRVVARQILLHSSAGFPACHSLGLSGCTDSDSGSSDAPAPSA